jgi:hypothetical protein
LLEDGAQRDDEDPLASAASDQLGEQDPDLDGLAEADAVGDEDPGARLGERLGGRDELVTRGLHGAAVADRELGGGRRRLAEQALEVKGGATVAR